MTNPSTSSPQRQVAQNVSAMPPAIIVADDLTGACDSAAAFLGKAETIRVLLHPESVRAEPGTVTAVSTETRNLSSAEAVDIIERTPASFCQFQGARIMFKKVDSAGRGHMAAETMAALCAWGAALALVAPAFPEAGRTVTNGVLHIRDSAQQDTSLDLAATFPEQDRDVIGLLPTGDEDELERAVRSAFDQGTWILICDAESQRDLSSLAIVASRIDQPVLWTGSAGLARALASLFPSSSSEHSADRAWPEGRTLLFVGTDHPVTAAQVSYLQQESALAARHTHRIEWNDSSAKYVRDTFCASSVSALILTGGDTAAFVLETLHAHAIRLAGELAPGIPWGFIEGGDADGCAVITKSGGFGHEDTLIQAFQFCSRRICEPA